jgi:hypothetical protein
MVKKFKKTSSNNQTSGVSGKTSIRMGATDFKSKVCLKKYFSKFILEVVKKNKKGKKCKVKDTAVNKHSVSTNRGTRD